MSTQPRALELADWCDANSSGIYRPSADAAAELRRLAAVEQERDRLHALNAELLEALKDLHCIYVTQGVAKTPAREVGMAWRDAAAAIKKASEAA